MHSSRQGVSPLRDASGNIAATASVCMQPSSGRGTTSLSGSALGLRHTTPPSSTWRIFRRAMPGVRRPPVKEISPRVPRLRMPGHLIRHASDTARFSTSGDSSTRLSRRQGWSSSLGWSRPSLGTSSKLSRLGSLIATRSGPSRAPRGTLERVRIEFEYQSRNFHTHGHPVDGCDVIVCWEHNWPDLPSRSPGTAVRDHGSTGSLKRRVDARPKTPTDRTGFDGADRLVLEEHSPTLEHSRVVFTSAY